MIRVTDAQAWSVYGIRGGGDMAGIAYPYFAPATMTNGRQRWFLRIRRDHPEIEDGKEVRCAVRRPQAPLLPTPPELFADVSVPIYLVEAEKSVLALTALADRTGRKLLALGLGGAWGWKGKVGIRETATGERVPEHAAIPDLTIWRDGRKTYVLLDANCVSNLQVEAARVALIRQLRKQGADVGVLNLPASSKDKNWNGPDDYLSVCGDEAMSKVIDDYVDGIGLLEDLVSYFREYVRVGEDVLSPWVLHSDCGKTLLLEVARARGAASHAGQ